MEETDWEGVGRVGRDLYTTNLTPGLRAYGEDLRNERGIEFRRWDPFRSKLAAFLLKGATEAPWAGARRVLYLGGAHGTTVSHLSDLLPGAEIFVVEKSPVVFAPLLALSRTRPNLYPILADAQLPERYSADVGPVDLLYQDIAQRGQAQIFGENADACLAPGGAGLLMLKVRSVTQSRSAGSVVDESRRELARHGLTVRATRDLAPFTREHVALTIGRSSPPPTVHG
ncbi:MAG: fibrillarin-like rRNA/tRNA 2'-O-methyltransferase [Thermoplasmata archaeon]|nr:fibrillarin-like rRNA/tRNA 2'-O-methyltransferase [Thermoplasmata archaeon]MCI4354246.1 fibrillarin-like rRNA/tRNA 2'-O-methyltransferase [Thermoplasmata archaeon]